MCDYVFGMPMMVWAGHFPMLMQRVSEPPRAEKPSIAQVMVENAVALQRAKPSRDPVADALSWEKTKAEFSMQTMFGPLSTRRSRCLLTATLSFGVLSVSGSWRGTGSRGGFRP